jgi:cobalt/nickel transport system permease protein
MIRLVETCAASNAWSGRCPAEKIAWGGGFLIGSLVVPPGPAHLAFAGAAFLLAAGSARVPLGAFLRVVASPWPLLAISIPVLTLRLGPGGWIWDPEGLDRLRLAAFRLAGAGGALALLILTTPVHELLSLLPRGPAGRALVDLASLAHRSLHAFLDASVCMRLGREARDLGRPLQARFCEAAALVGDLWIRSFERLQRLELGRAAREIGDGGLPVHPGVARGSRGAVLAAWGAAVAVGSAVWVAVGAM